MFCWRKLLNRDYLNVSYWQSRHLCRKNCPASVKQIAISSPKGGYKWNYILEFWNGRRGWGTKIEKYQKIDKWKCKNKLLKFWKIWFDNMASRSIYYYINESPINVTLKSIKAMISYNRVAGLIRIDYYSHTIQKVT